MIISKSGKVVGRLDEETLALTDVRSAKLRQLVDDWRENGIEELGPGEWHGDGPQPDCVTAVYVTPFDKESLDFIEHKLLIAGFEVQRD